MNSLSRMNRDISSQAISNIIVDKNSVSSGEDIKIIVNYNDKNGKINPGDYIKIDLGNNESVTVNGYREKKGLFFKGILVGHFEVAGSEAKIIFNNQVEAFLQGSVSGFIDFSAKIRNESHSNQTTSIISGGQYININVEKESSGGTSSQFFYKTGDIQTDNLEEVRWFLIFNSVGDEYSGYIDIDDQIQNPENHKIIKESVAITRVDHIGNSKSYYGTEGLTEFNNETGSTLVFTEDSVYGEIPWDRIAHSQISINYNTKILNPRAESFSNKVILNNSQQIIQEENFSVKNVSANAGIIGSKKNELRIYKFIKDSGKSLEGVTFELKREDGKEIQDGLTRIKLTTNEYGWISIENIPNGKYIVKEISAPEGYIYDSDEEYKFEMKNDDTEGKVLEIYNDRVKDQKIKVKKTWEGTPLKEIKVKLNIFSASDAKKTESLILNEENNWQGEFKDLPIVDSKGFKIDYSITEVINVDGEEIELNNNEEKVIEGVKYKSTIKEVKNSEEKILKEYEINNIVESEKPLEPEKTSVKVQKEWIGTAGESAEIILLKNNEEYKTVELNEKNNWEYEFKDLPVVDNINDSNSNIYSIKETPVKGYTTTIEEISVNNYTVINTEDIEKIDLTVEKVWVGLEKEYDGDVNLELYRNGEHYIDGEKEYTITLNKNTGWKYIFKDLPKYDENGEEYIYTIEEPGLDEERFSVEVFNKEGTENHIIVENSVRFRDVHVKKIWEGKVGESAKFLLFEAVRDEFGNLLKKTN